MKILIRGDGTYELGSSFSKLHKFINQGGHEEAYYNIFPHTVSYIDSALRTPLHCTCIKGSEFNYVSRRLIRHGADINSRDFYGKTPLHYSCKISDSKMILHLLKMGADPTIIDNNEMCPLFYYFEGPCLSRDIQYELNIVKLFIQKGSTYNVTVNKIRLKNTATFLYKSNRIAMSQKPIENCLIKRFGTLAMDMIIDDKEELYIHRKGNGLSLLDHACGSNGYAHSGVVKLLLERNVKTEDNYEHSSLFWSYFYEFTGISIQLLEAGAKLNWLDYEYHDEIIEGVVKTKIEIKQRRWDRRKTYVYLRDYPSKLSIGVLGTLVDKLVNVGEDGVFRNILGFI